MFPPLIDKYNGKRISCAHVRPASLFPWFCFHFGAVRHIDIHPTSGDSCMNDIPSHSFAIMAYKGAPFLEEMVQSVLKPVGIVVCRMFKTRAIVKNVALYMRQFLLGNGILIGCSHATKLAVLANKKGLEYSRPFCCEKLAVRKIIFYSFLRCFHGFLPLRPVGRAYFAIFFEVL